MRVEAVEPVLTDDCFSVKVSRGVAEVDVVQHVTAHDMASRQRILIGDRFKQKNDGERRRDSETVQLYMMPG